MGLMIGCGNLFAQDKNQAKEMSVSTYPNPTSEGFYVNAGETTALVIIYNISGELLITKTISGKEYIPVDGLRKGTYFVKITTNQGSLTKKLIVK
jgi:pectate lyase